MNFKRAAQGGLTIQLDTEEQEILLETLKLYPLVPATHQRLSQATEAQSPENQRLLEESLAEQRAENKRQLEALIQTPERWKQVGKRWQLRLAAGEVEWLLQVFNDIRVGSWLRLGEPDEDKPHRCLADFVAPIGTAPDYVGAFAVTAGLGVDELVRHYEAQHDDYRAALAELGARVTRLDDADAFPDGVFVEDTALVLDEVAISMRPGAESRRGEVSGILTELMRYREVKPSQYARSRLRPASRRELSDDTLGDDARCMTPVEQVLDRDAAPFAVVQRILVGVHREVAIKHGTFARHARPCFCSQQGVQRFVAVLQRIADGLPQKPRYARDQLGPEGPRDHVAPERQRQPRERLPRLPELEHTRQPFPLVQQPPFMNEQHRIDSAALHRLKRTTERRDGHDHRLELRHEQLEHEIRRGPQPRHANAKPSQILHP